MVLLQGKTVLITGVSKGLGRAIALAYAREGARLSICARGSEALEKVAREARDLGAEVIAISGDVSNPGHIERIVSLTEKHYGEIDILVNNASILGPSPMPYLSDYPADDFLEVLRINTYGPFLMTQRVMSGMLHKGEGSVINITSEAGSVGYPGWGAYGVSKFGLEGLTEIWAAELDDTNIRVNMVDPGEMNTEMHALAIPDADPSDFPRPEEITDVFVYLASDESRAVNGQRFEAQHFQK